MMISSPKWRPKSTDVPERAESARAWHAPQRDTAMIHGKAARDITENAGPGMPYPLQGRRVEGCRSSSSVFVMANADALSLSLRLSLRIVIY